MILLRASLLWLFSIGLLVGLNLLDSYVPRDSFGDYSSVGAERVFEFGENLFKLVTASLIFSVLRTFLLPHLSIDDIVRNRGEFVGMPPQIRGAAIIAWALVYVTVVYSFLMV